jgi:hypothetical protein
MPEAQAHRQSGIGVFPHGVQILPRSGRPPVCQRGVLWTPIHPLKTRGFGTGRPEVCPTFPGSERGANAKMRPRTLFLWLGFTVGGIGRGHLRTHLLPPRAEFLLEGLYDVGVVGGHVV